MTAAFAPPCRGPFSAATPATMVECRSVRVAAATRAANVDAFSSWSAWRINPTSNARAASAPGRSPVRRYRKLAACPSAGSGVIGAPPAASLPSVATRVPVWAVSRTALRRDAPAESSPASGS